MRRQQGDVPCIFASLNLEHIDFTMDELCRPAPAKDDNYPCITLSSKSFSFCLGVFAIMEDDSRMIIHCSNNKCRSQVYDSYSNSRQSRGNKMCMYGGI
ncbi:uncharacterized protein [Nicotiana sylvestris]|uniref:uncharacterized protein isoform X2 n=1 Tax=Nicotiana sylvestris TaxID=4096 RepID=UPI00388C4DA0